MPYKQTREHTVQGLMETFDISQRDEIITLLAKYDQLDIPNYWSFFRTDTEFFWRKATWDRACYASTFEKLISDIQEYLA